MSNIKVTIKKEHLSRFIKGSIKYYLMSAGVRTSDGIEEPFYQFPDQFEIEIPASQIDALPLLNEFLRENVVTCHQCKDEVILSNWRRF